MLKKIGLIALLTLILGLSARVHAEAPDSTLGDLPSLEPAPQVLTQKPDPAVLEDVAAFKQKLGTGWEVTLNSQGTRIVSIGKEFAEIKESPFARQKSPAEYIRLTNKMEKTAKDFLRDNARFFQLRTDLADLQESDAYEPGISSGYRVDFRQTYKGLSVFDSDSHHGTGVYVSMNAAGIISDVSSDYVPNLKNISTSPRLLKSDVIAVANKNAVENKIKIENELISSTDGNAEVIEKLKKNEKKFMKKPDPNLIIYAGVEKPILAYKFDLGGFVHKTFVIDANNGEINNTLSFPNAVDWTSSIVAFD